MAINRITPHGCSFSRIWTTSNLHIIPWVKNVLVYPSDWMLRSKQPVTISYISLSYSQSHTSKHGQSDSPVEATTLLPVRINLLSLLAHRHTTQILSTHANTLNMLEILLLPHTMRPPGQWSSGRVVSLRLVGCAFNVWHHCCPQIPQGMMGSSWGPSGCDNYWDLNFCTCYVYHIHNPHAHTVCQLCVNTHNCFLQVFCVDT